MSTGDSIYLVTACTSPAEFVAAFRRYIDRGALFVPTTAPLPAGRRGPVMVTLRDGGVMLAGEVEIATSSSRPGGMHGRAGMTVRFVSPDEPSRAVLGELERARLTAPTGAVTATPRPRPAGLPDGPRPTPPPVTGTLDYALARAEALVLGDLTLMVEVTPPTAPPPTAPPPFATPPPTLPLGALPRPKPGTDAPRPATPPKAGPKFVMPSIPGRAKAPTVPPIPAAPASPATPALAALAAIPTLPTLPGIAAEAAAATPPRIKTAPLTPSVPGPARATAEATTPPPIAPIAGRGGTRPMPAEVTPPATVVSMDAVAPPPDVDPQLLAALTAPGAPVAPGAIPASTTVATDDAADEDDEDGGFTEIGPAPAPNPVAPPPLASSQLLPGRAAPIAAGPVTAPTLGAELGEGAALGDPTEIFEIPQVADDTDGKRRAAALADDTDGKRREVPRGDDTDVGRPLPPVIVGVGGVGSPRGGRPPEFEATVTTPIPPMVPATHPPASPLGAGRRPAAELGPHRHTAIGIAVSPPPIGEDTSDDVLPAPPPPALGAPGADLDALGLDTAAELAAAPPVAAARISEELAAPPLAPVLPAGGGPGGLPRAVSEVDAYASTDAQRMRPNLPPPREPTGDWTMAPDADEPVPLPAEARAPRIVLPKSGDWTITPDDDSPDGWATPAPPTMVTSAVAPSGEPALGPPGAPSRPPARPRGRAAIPRDELTPPPALPPSPDEGPKVEIDPSLARTPSAELPAIGHGLPLGPIPSSYGVATFGPGEAPPIGPAGVAASDRGVTDAGTGFFAANEAERPSQVRYGGLGGTAATPILRTPRQRQRRILVIGISAAILVVVGLLAVTLVGGKRGSSRDAAPKSPAVAPTTTTTTTGDAGPAAAVTVADAAAVIVADAAAGPDAGPDDAAVAADVTVDAAVAPTCHATISSDPAGAEVLAGAQLLGTTPTTLDLPCAAITLTIRKGKLPPVTKALTPTPAGVAFTAHLVAPHPVAPRPAAPRPLTAVKVTSTPAGATITVSGKKLGTTPATIKLPLGAATTLTITKDGFAPIAQKVTPKAQTPPVSVTLKPAKGRPAGR